MWVAWRRRQGDEWGKPLATTATEDEAWAAIYRAMDLAEPGSYDSVVLPEGVKP